MARDAAPAGRRGGPRPPFDPELAGPLKDLAAALPPLLPDGIAAARAGAAAMALSRGQLAGDGVFAVEEHLVDGYQDGPPVRVLLLRPATAAGSAPVLLHVHGGGMVLGDPTSGLDVVLDLALELGVVVASVEYRLAPEHPYPAALEDCYAGLTWLAEHADEAGVDPGRIVVEGASAGGGLAAAVALMARDRGGPRLLGQMLSCPMLDDRNDTLSGFQMAGAGLWDRTSNRTGWDALLDGGSGGPDVSPYAAPARAADLGGLPPAFIDVGSAETFRDESVAYASRLWAAGGRAELHVWPGGFHGFAVMVPDAALSRDANDAGLRWLRRLLAQS
ncbi:Acetyl esterase/lipase [Actinacidiphila yanglinensis]|uniref:Acetyl esterase/lipase n=1 Tax=Actinacidiphila yanglinensis TaxID=310779 RepID=A0A1H6E7A4_9ACTN|nr:alpha/beta hydrolase [Actinacidiphila yanglinensis]SEG93131.1 Acetyl esterase/lipase [Actinacidiphila yanglinensis]